MADFLKEPLETIDCLKYWKKFEAKAEGNVVKRALARLAMQALTPPPTSTDVERLFSVASNILTEKRNRLLPANVEKLLFLKANMENYNFQV